MLGSRLVCRHLKRKNSLAAKRRIRELETELAIHRRATELLKEKASWVQEGTKVANPYLGPMMPGCGQKVGGAD
jgi:hypothetical protein